MRILEPLTLGTATAPNRVLFGPHETNLGTGRAIGDRHLAYYERRAAGGTGILVAEEAAVHASDWPYERAPLAEECGPGWERLAAVGRRHGTVVLAGLGHTGGQGASAYSQRELWAPSGVPEVNTREMPKAMEPEDIDAVVRGFGAATRRAVGAGLDGVEINAGQNSLIRQFLSGLNNLRDDDYGADKTRFAREVLHAVRVAAGDRVVGLRLSCDELAPWAGIVPEAAAEIAVSLLPWIDYLVVVRGGIFSVAGTRPDGHDEPGFNLGLAGQIRAAVAGRVPVFAQGSIVDIGQAEWAIGDGRCDGVEMTRAQIADAQLVRKAAAGEPDRIRPCILCNQTCKVRDNRNPILSCVVDPRTGHELTDPDPEPTAVPNAATASATPAMATIPNGAIAARTAPAPHEVLVVGGGIAGLEAARVLAGRGHRVTVAERSSGTGGMIRTAARGAGRDRLDRIADWLAAECERLGVTIETETTVDPTRVAGAEAAGIEVVLCTGSVSGSRPDWRTYQATRAAVIVDADAVLAGTPAAADDSTTAADDPTAPTDPAAAGATDAPRTATTLGAPGLPAGPIAIWDPIGGPIGISVAELLATAGREVTLITPDLIVGTLLSRSGDLAPANVRLESAGVRLHKRAVLRSVEKNGAVVEDRFTGETTTIKAAAVIDAGTRLPADELFEATGHRLPRAGDAVAPRTVYEAILEGRRVALGLDGGRG